MRTKFFIPINKEVHHQWTRTRYVAVKGKQATAYCFDGEKVDVSEVWFLNTNNAHNSKAVTLKVAKARKQPL